MKTKLWIIGWLVISISVLLVIGGSVYKVDPYFHYHKPYTDIYYYTLDNQRSQNDGITRYFDYNALITGTSMTENFKTSEFDEIFGMNSIKVSYSGGTYKEINDNIRVALENNRNLSMIVRGLDTGMFFYSPDQMRYDLGEYPMYLYDDNCINDVNYLFNKDVIFSRVYMMEKAIHEEGFIPGITSFDEYSRWQEKVSFGVNTVLPDGLSYHGVGEPVHLSEEDKNMISRNIYQNVTSLADEYPETSFYYFFTPYSIAWYKELVEEGTIYRQIEAEQYIIELILEHENIKLFSCNAVEEIITDLNNYNDTAHYATWINSYILMCMHDDICRITKDNYLGYLDKELELLINYDYTILSEQVDYKNDYYPATCMNRVMW